MGTWNGTDVHWENLSYRLIRDRSGAPWSVLARVHDMLFMAPRRAVVHKHISCNVISGAGFSLSCLTLPANLRPPYMKLDWHAQIILRLVIRPDRNFEGPATEQLTGTLCSFASMFSIGTSHGCVRRVRGLVPPNRKSRRGALHPRHFLHLRYGSLVSTPGDRAILPSTVHRRPTATRQEVLAG